MSVDAAVPITRRWTWRVLIGVVLLVVGSAIGWAATAVFSPPSDVLADEATTTIELVDGSVGSSITMSAVAEWESSPAGSNQAAGIVTAVHVISGGEIVAGTPLYDVNLRPVVAAAGETPAFRSLSRDAVGSDVKQLQAFLSALGWYSGDADGEFGPRTEQAVKDWQKATGVAVDGVVGMGDILFVPTLPARIILNGDIVFRGAMLGGGELVADVLASEPIFRLPATTGQAATIPAGTSVQLKFSDFTWAASVGEQRVASEGDQVDLLLEGVDNASICGADCNSLSSTNQNSMIADVITQSTVKGVIVPSVALRSNADGTVSVTDANGRLHPVTVVAAAKGVSVIEGAPAGLRVRVAEDAGTAP